MTDVALSLLALIGGGVTLELFTTALSPLGLEGERWFRSHAEASETAQESWAS